VVKESQAGTRNPEQDWFEVKGLGFDEFGKVIRVGCEGNALFINNERESIVVTEIDEEANLLNDFKYELRPIIQEDEIKDHALFGEKKDQIAILTKNQDLLIFKVDLEEKTFHMLSQHKGSGQNTARNGVTLKICPNGRFIFVHTIIPYKTGDLLVFEYLEELQKLELRTTMNVQDLGDCFWDLIIWDYSEFGKLMISSVNYSGDKAFHHFEFDIENYGLKKVTLKSTMVDQNDHVWRLYPVDRDSFYYANGKGEVYKGLMEIFD
jgi:hypothetical protein